MQLLRAIREKMIALVSLVPVLSGVQHRCVHATQLSFERKLVYIEDMMIERRLENDVHNQVMEEVEEATPDLFRRMKEVRASGCGPSNAFGTIAVSQISSTDKECRCPFGVIMRMIPISPFLTFTSCYRHFDLSVLTDGDRARRSAALLTPICGSRCLFQIALSTFDHACLFACHGLGGESRFIPRRTRSTRAEGGSGLARSSAAGKLTAVSF